MTFSRAFRQVFWIISTVADWESGCRRNYLDLSLLFLYLLTKYKRNDLIYLFIHSSLFFSTLSISCWILDQNCKVSAKNGNVFDDDCVEIDEFWLKVLVFYEKLFKMAKISIPKPSITTIGARVILLKLYSSSLGKIVKSWFG